MGVRPDTTSEVVRHPAGPIRGLFSETAVLTRRLLVRAARTPMTMVHGLVLPTSFLLTLKVVFGDSITEITGQNSLYRSVALVTLISAMSGSSTGMVGINTERFDGFLARLWALPIRRAAGLLARLNAETVRLLFTTLVILGVGLALGFRFRCGLGAAVLWVAVPVIFGVAFAALATAAALYWPRAIMVEATQPVIVVGATFCTGFVPLDMYPEWVQPAVRNQPMSLAVDAMRGLSAGGPVWSPIMGCLLWCGATVLVCLWPIMVGYRRASTK
jgi:ABC-2 type transport system permease protein